MELTRNASTVFGSATRLLNGARGVLRQRNGAGGVVDQYNTALATASPFSSLWEAVRDDLDHGRDRQAVAADLNALLRSCREANRETEADAVVDVLDSVYGFASPNSRL